MGSLLVWRNLLHAKLRTAAAVLGAAVPVVLVFVQLGLYDAVMTGATLVYDALDFDLVLLSRDYVSLAKPGTLPRDRLHQARALPEVHEAAPLYIAFHLWRNPGTGALRELAVFACDPRRRTFRLPEVAERIEVLRRLDTALIDRVTRPEYGAQAAGVTAELGRRTVTIVGQYTLPLGFLADGAVLVSDETFARLPGHRSLENVSAGLVTLRPGIDAGAVARELRARLPADVRVLTRTALARHERGYWSASTSIGLIFGSGILVGFAVQVILLYQLVSTDVVKRLPEYATLKAMGYGARRLSWIVIQHGLVIALVGFALGLLLALGLSRNMADATLLPIAIDGARVAEVVVGTLALAVLASLLAVRKLRAADPADLW